MSGEDAKNIYCPGYFPSKDEGNLTMIFTSIFVYIPHHLIVLQLNPFGLRVDREGWWFEHSMSFVGLNVPREC